jgi:hypothetical protein
MSYEPREKERKRVQIWGRGDVVRVCRAGEVTTPDLTVPRNPRLLGPEVGYGVSFCDVKAAIAADCGPIGVFGPCWGSGPVGARGGVPVNSIRASPVGPRQTAPPSPPCGPAWRGPKARRVVALSRSQPRSKFGASFFCHAVPDLLT